MEKILQSKSKTFLVFCFCFLLGIVFLSFEEEKFFPTLVFYSTLGSVFFILFCWKKKLVRFLLLCFLFVMLGMLRVNSVIPEREKNNLTFYHGQQAILHGVVAGEPDVREGKVNYIFRVEEISQGENREAVNGKILLGLSLYPRYEYGQKAIVTCKLQTPEPIEKFHYEKYLAVQGIWSVCPSPKFEAVEGEPKNNLWKFIYDFKAPIAENISLLWHEPYASFVAGILYGYRGGLGSLGEDFNRTGVTHIVAVSGFNITIIATLLSSMLIFCSVPRKYAFWLVVIGIAVFVIFTGASSSVVRAGIMGILVLVARQMGRASRIHNVLLLTVTLMALHSPFVLLWDAGFQLSFLSTCGLVYLSPLLEKYCQKIPNFLNVRESLVSTMSAIIFTLPLILFQFERLSVVAPLVNILILPLIPLVMLLGFMTLVLSFIFWPVAQGIAMITYWGLSYIVEVVKFFSRLSFASIEIQISFFLLVLFYLYLICFITKTQQKTHLL